MRDGLKILAVLCLIGDITSAAPQGAKSGEPARSDYKADAQTKHVLSLTTNVAGKPAVLRADVSRFAGAIFSLTWDGFEFIDSHDHGRELQSAVAFDSLGPCYNPTEAGSQWDSTGAHSSSQVLRARVEGDVLTTAVDAAFWFKPGTPVATRGGCGWGVRPDKNAAVNTTVRGGYIISKRVRFGEGEMANSLIYQATFTVPRPHEAARFDAFVAYLSPEMSDIFEFEDGKLTGLDTSKSFGLRKRPVVYSTPDGGKAFSLSCRSDGMIYQFNLYPAAKVNALHCINDVEHLEPGDYSFDGRILFGTKADVVRALTQLSRG